MKSVMAQAATKSQDSSASKRHFHWTQKVGSEDDHEHDDHHDHDHNHVALPTTLFKSSSSSRPSSDQEDRKNNKEREYFHHNTTATTNAEKPQQEHPLGGGGAVSSTRPRKLSQVAVARLRSAVLTAFGRNRHGLPRGGLGPRVVGTLFGSRRGHVHFAFQKDPSSPPALLIELATPINGLVKEMASGLVRIALECDKAKEEKARGGSRLLEERVWRTFCNGKKCGFATRRDCGPRDWKILKAVEPISMGAGVLPPSGFDDNDHHDPRDQGEAEAGDEIMYMRAKFERIVGSRDSEAFYMMNPDSNGAPELSIYLLRV